MAPPHDLRRPYKRTPISDQQRRREISLQRQSQHRLNAQQQARHLATTILSLPHSNSEPDSEPTTSEPEPIIEDAEPIVEDAEDVEDVGGDFDVRKAARVRGPEARRWFAKQIMIPEWMIDVPERLNKDWYVLARPTGKRCFVVSSNGTTVSRMRNGSLLHRFPSALPNGARTKDSIRSAHSYCILDCIFHEVDQTYYVIDMVYWAGISCYECTAEFRFFWLHSQLAESGACNAPSVHHAYRFSPITVYNCDIDGLQAAYGGVTPYVKDGLLFYNKHAHYQSGNTPLALVWKDENCSQYVIDTDSNGQIPSQQQVVLELQDDGKLITSDEPSVVLGCSSMDFIQQAGLRSKNLLRFTVNEGGLVFVDGKLERADLQYTGKVNRARAFADSYSKIVFQYMARHSPLKIEHLLASIASPTDQNCETSEVDMAG